MQASPPIADGSGWAGVVAELTRSGIPLVAPANSLRGLTSDTDYVAGVFVRATDSLLGPALIPGQYPTGDEAKPGTEFFIDPAQYHASFCADVSDDVATLMAITWKPISQIGFSDITADPAWKKLPAWAVLGTADKAIGISQLREMARRAKANTVEVEGASHVVMVSRPTKVANQIRTALSSVFS